MTHGKQNNEKVEKGNGEGEETGKALKSQERKRELARQK